MKGVTDTESLAQLARLARLELEPGELARLGPELDRILESFRILERHESPLAGDSAKSAGAPPNGAASGRTREDRRAPSLTRDELLQAAPESEDGFFRVPRTVRGPQ